MKVLTALSVGLLMALPIAATAQDSSKIAASSGGMELDDLIARFAKRTGRRGGLYDADAPHGADRGALG